MGINIGDAIGGDIVKKAPQVQKAFRRVGKEIEGVRRIEEATAKGRQNLKRITEEQLELERRVGRERKANITKVTLAATIAERDLAAAYEEEETALARAINAEFEHNAAVKKGTVSMEERQRLMQAETDALNAAERAETRRIRALKTAIAAAHEEANVLDHRITMERQLEKVYDRKAEQERQLLTLARQRTDAQGNVVESLYDTVEAEKKLDDAAQNRADNDKKRADARASQDDAAAIRKRIALERDEYRAHAENARRNAKEEELRGKATQRGGFRGFMNETQRIIGSIAGVRLQGKAGLALMAAAADAVYETVQITGAAAQSLALLPALAATAGAGIGTLALATAGFGDTVKELGPGGDLEKFAQGIQNLSPAAQQAALSIQQIFPELTKLQQAVQESFFEGLGGEIETLSAKYLPSVQGMTTGIAQSFNALLKGLGADLMQPGTFAQIQGIFNDIGDTIRNLTPAVRDFVQAFLDITSVGASLLPGLATDVAGVAREFANFIRQARDSGKLREFMEDGIAAVKLLTSTIYDMAAALASAFGLDRAGQNVEDFRVIVERFALGWNLLSGDIDGVKEHFENLLDLMTPKYRNFFADIPEAANTAFNAVVKGINWVSDQIEAALVRPLQPFVNAWNAMANTMAGKKLGMDPMTISADLFPTIPERPVGDWAPGTQRIPGVREGFYRDRAGVEHPLPGRGTNPDFAAGGPYGVPAAPPGPGEDKTPPLNIPREQFGLESIPLGQFPGAGWDAGSVDFGPLGPPGKVDPQKVFDAQSTEINSRQAVEQARLKVAEMIAKNNDADQKNNVDLNDIANARLDVQDKERKYISDQRDLLEAQNGTIKKGKQNQQEIGAQLDKDFGLSKGLGGLAENLFKFIANVAAAPLLGKLAVGAQDSAGKGTGLLGQFYVPDDSDTGTGTGQPGVAGSLLDRITGRTATTTAQTTGGPTTSPTTSGAGYAGDAALLANVPAGKYGREYGSDLTQGLGDCSSAVADLVNIMDGMPTNDANTPWTGTEADWLTQRGFLPTDVPMPGTFQVGLDPVHHTQATLPGGTNFNWGSDPAAQAGGRSGGGAWGDPRFTQHFYRPVDGSPGVPAAGAPGVAPSAGGVPAAGATPVFVTNWPGGAITGGAGAPAGAPPAVGAPPTVNAPITVNPPGGGGPSTNTNPALDNPPAPGATPPTYGGYPAAPGPVAPPTPGPRTYTGGGGTYGQPPAAQQGVGPPVGPLPPLAPGSYPSGGGPGGLGLSPLLGQSPTAPASDVPLPGGPITPGVPGTPDGPPIGYPGGPPVNAVPGNQGPATATPNAPGSTLPGRYPGAGLNVPKGSGVKIGGGILGGAESAAGGAANMFAPGAGQAAQIGIDEINRAIQFGSQVAGIAVNGLLETFLPNESPLADIGGSWFGRIGGAVAGVSAAAPNLAGLMGSGNPAKERQPGQAPAPGAAEPPLTPEQAAEHGKTQGAPPGPGTVVNQTITSPQDPEKIEKAATYHLEHANMSPTS